MHLLRCRIDPKGLEVLAWVFQTSFVVMPEISRLTASVSLEACELPFFRITGPHRVSLRFRDAYVANLDFSHYGNEGCSLRRYAHQGFVG